MRQDRSAVARGVSVLLVVVFMAVSASAVTADRDSPPWRKAVDRIVNMIRRSLGDEIVSPRP
jgi:hypothetical protein